MNADKLQAMQNQVRIGGKGTPRRKKKVVHKSGGGDDKKLQAALKKLQVNPIQGIEEVNMFQSSGTVLHFDKPKVQANLQAKTFTVNGSGSSKSLQDLLPGILNQLGPENLAGLRKLAEQYQGELANAGRQEDDDDDVPELVEKFDVTAQS
jgi:nascent polypeptide-associated complex subunit beta